MEEITEDYIFHKLCIENFMADTVSLRHMKKVYGTFRLFILTSLAANKFLEKLTLI
jgi:hypothetical protein